MATVLTTGSSVTCSHQGRVALSSSAKLKVANNPVLLSTDFASWGITNCTQTGGPPTPCTNIVSVATGPASKLTVGRVPVMLDTLAGPTNGAPPGTVSATAGHTKLTAS